MGAALTVATRAGTTATFDELNKYFTINQMPIVSGRYWNNGFGSGRDSLYFISKGYVVYAIDPEDEFVKHGKDIGISNVYQLKAENITFLNMFDGIWACASLLHVHSKALNDVFKRCYVALKEKGVMYVSFKFGDFEGIRNGRYYLDLNEKTLAKHLVNSGLKIDSVKITKDVRPGRDDVWLNAILVKE